MRSVNCGGLYRSAKRNFSALYVPGNKAKDDFAVLMPYLDLQEKFENVDAMKRNISLRHMNIQFETIYNLYGAYIALKDKKNELEERRSKIADLLKSSGKSADNKSPDELKNEGKIIRNEWKTVREKLYPIEEDLIEGVLNLPNKLHAKTPEFEPKILYKHNEIDAEDYKYHLKYIDQIDYKNSTNYYLKNEAAMFDLEMPLEITANFVDNRFSQFSNPDFCRSLLLEAARIKETSHFVVEEENEDKINKLHLTGGSSLTSFLAYISKFSIYPAALPMRLVASGRQYLLQDGSEKGLYTTLQTNSVQLFTATACDKTADEEFEKQLNLLKTIYKQFDLHYRIILQPAKNLLPAESLRASIQMLSPALNHYVEVAFLSSYSNFISKRILFNYKEKKLHKFPSIISGMAFNSALMIALLLEQNKLINFVKSKNW